MEPTDAEQIKAVLGGDTSAFESLIAKYQPRVFGTARKYARRESEVEDIVQEVFLKAFNKLSTFRGDSPFEHWLMRLAVRTCYDFLREHQRNREQTLSDITDEESSWLERIATDGDRTGDADSAAAARLVIHKLLETLSPESRLIIQLLEIEEKSLKEIAQLTGWSIPMIKVRAFRARAAMRKTLERMEKDRYL
ncbi:MAG TPA: sigma-70 family RNA polymerase sigma factor [Verrucomicrobiae bacterium]